ncbi:hypothetical protein GF386_03910 [Candidatus Pacearchaeota archaeon]|nr:hypothetical protein [Candidatus Pacearchaeota archaeon]MBD3283293.1 hypothetical protein [Candidatus Pacearchaeota archaeon]
MIGYGPRLSFLKSFEEESKEIPMARALRENSYLAQLERERESAQRLSDDFMKGYIQAYESHGYPRIRKLLQKFLGGTEESEGNGDPVRVSAFRKILEDRASS